MPAAGTLRHRIVIERGTEVQNAFGEPITTWATFAERYAAILPQSGREFIGAQQVVPELTHLVRLRYVAGVTSKMRIRFGSRVFDILAPLDEEARGVEVTFACRELVA